MILAVDKIGKYLATSLHSGRTVAMHDNHVGFFEERTSWVNKSTVTRAERTSRRKLFNWCVLAIPRRLLVLNRF